MGGGCEEGQESEVGGRWLGGVGGVGRVRGEATQDLHWRSSGQWIWHQLFLFRICPRDVLGGSL